MLLKAPNCDRVIFEFSFPTCQIDVQGFPTYRKLLQYKNVLTNVTRPSVGCWSVSRLLLSVDHPSFCIVSQTCGTSRPLTVVIWPFEHVELAAEAVSQRNHSDTPAIHCL